MMKITRTRAGVVVVALCALVAVASGQDERRNERRLGRPRPTRTPSTRYYGAQEKAAAMETSKGKIFLLNGGTLYKIDQETLQREASVRLSDVEKKDPKNEPGERRKPHPLLTRFDKNGDGRLSAEELPNPNVIRNLDRNGDGFVSEDELPKMIQARSPPAKRFSGPAILRIVGPDVLVFVGDRLFKFNAADLAPKGSVEVPDSSRPKSRARAAGNPDPRNNDARRRKKRGMQVRKKREPAAGEKDDPGKKPLPKKERDLF